VWLVKKMIKKKLTLVTMTLGTKERSYAAANIHHGKKGQRNAALKRVKTQERKKVHGKKRNKRGRRGRGENWVLGCFR